ncbi:MAG TPA: sulfotransferase [Steroidobacteraceae bacterium]|nr:sulfotransferase [Steroidobacteraceae bacterium]
MSRASHRVLLPAAVDGHRNAIRSSSPASGDPLFIIGTGRCGSTLFHDLLTRHPHVSFMTSLANRHPTKPAYNRTCVSCIDIAGSTFRRKYFPVEAYGFWDHYFHGFSRPFRDLTADDASPCAVTALRTATRQFVTARRPRMIFKITGWPRIGFLQAVYPRAKFISVIRDGRAVANSLLNVHFWDGWLGPGKWSWGPLDTARDARWQHYDRSFVALAALQWEILMEAYAEAKACMPDPSQLLQIRYEDLCSDPVSVFRTATDFAGLTFNSSFERCIASARLQDANQKWRQDLTPAQQAILEACMGPSLAQWGYEVQPSAIAGAVHPSVTPVVHAAIKPTAMSLS